MRGLNVPDCADGTEMVAFTLDGRVLVSTLSYVS
jgi:hypothetical protein